MEGAVSGRWYVSGARQRISPGPMSRLQEAVVICNEDGAVAYVLCGQDKHLQALHEARVMVAALNADWERRKTNVS